MVTQEQKNTYKALLKQQKALIKKVSRKFKWTNRIIILAGVALGLLIGIKGARLEDKGVISPGSFDLYLLFGLFLYYIFTLFHIIIHETGHLIFGLLTGYRFVSFRIFSFIFIKQGDRIIRKKYSVKGTAGQCLMMPSERNEDGSFPFVLYNLGGGLTNLIVSIPFIVVLTYIDNAVICTALFVFILSGVITGITNLIPLDLGVQNDGMNVKGMLKYKFLRDSFYLQLKVYHDLVNGKLITEYAPDMFALPDDSAADKYTLTTFNYMFAYYCFLAKHDFESAYAYLLKMLEKADKLHLGTLNVVHAEQLFFMVLYHRPVEEIAALYKRVKLILAAGKNDISLQRINYIYEALLSEEEKKDIMTLINNKVPKKWKKCNLEKLKNDIDKIAASYPAIGEAVMNMDIIDYCCKLCNNEQENQLENRQENN